MDDSARTVDVLIVGGGPAGSSAAIVLARARRRVLLCDHGRPRNAASAGIHGYLTRDGIVPAEFRRVAHEELAHYGVTFEHLAVKKIEASGDGFIALLEDGRRIEARRILIATGVVDRMPRLRGVDELYGKSVHHCPFCDGWEWRDRALALYGKGHAAYGSALSLKTWSADLVICSDGPSRLTPAQRGELEAYGIRIDARRIERLEGRDGMLERIAFNGGGTLARDALFFSTGNLQADRLAIELGCRVDAKGAIPCDRTQRTNVPGVYVAGDASRDVQFVVVAAAEGAKAAVHIHAELVREARMALRG